MPHYLTHVSYMVGIINDALLEEKALSPPGL